MKVLKFGGTSVGKPERMHQVASIISSDETPKIVVLSALSGTTNTLVSIGEYLSLNKKDEAEKEISNLQEHYNDFKNGLVKSELSRINIQAIIDEHFGFMRSLLHGKFNSESNK